MYSTHVHTNTISGFFSTTLPIHLHLHIWQKNYPLSFSSHFLFFTGTNRHGGLPESVIQLPREEKQQVDQDKDEQLDVDMEDYGDDDFDIYPSSPQDEYSTEQETESDTDLSATEEETVDHRYMICCLLAKDFVSNNLYKYTNAYPIYMCI